MTWKFLLIYLMGMLNAFANPIEEMYFYNEDSHKSANQPLFISLGSTCHVAIALKALNIRDAAYPFDWIITSDLDNLISVLDDGLAHYTDPDHFALREGIPGYINLYYNIGFIHDFTPDATGLSVEKIAEEWISFKERYDRRVERFKQLSQYSGKVYFMRSMWGHSFEGANGEFNENNAKAQKLRDALARSFPSLDFTLIIVSHPDLNIPPIGNIPNVVEFKIDRGHQSLERAIKELTK